MKIPTFKNKQLFDTVFTHRSYLNEAANKIESNERIEFLGDSILSFVVSSHIFAKYPDLKEGELTNLRAILTNTETLYMIATELDLGQYLKLSKGEDEGGGRKNKSILADTLEAIIGGLYLDQGIEAAQHFIEEIILSRIDAIMGQQGLKDAKSTLQEEVQEQLKISPTYKIVREEGPDHAKIFTIQAVVDNTILGEGSGKSKQEAEKNAARDALEKKIYKKFSVS